MYREAKKFKMSTHWLPTPFIQRHSKRYYFLNTLG